MYFRNYKALIISLSLILSLAASGLAQVKSGDGSPYQRLLIMRQKLDAMRKSISGAQSAFKDDDKSKDKKVDKATLDTPLARLKGLDKEANSFISQIANLSGKVERSEKYEAADIDQLETSVGELQTRVDNTISETAKDRAAPVSNVGQAREVKMKTKKLLGLIPYGKERDEYEELIGSVTPGRDKELFIVATREVRKNNYDVGRLLFQTIITTYPDSSYLPMAKLAVADSFYLEGGTSSLVQALASYQDWLTFFPTHPLADRVLLKIAECEMRQIGLPDRDPTHTKRAEQRLRALLQQYPNSALTKDVKQRLVEVQDNAGLHNLYVANYYYDLAVTQKKGGLKGAQSRYRENIDKYPDFTFNDENLFKLAVTYQIEEETDEAAKYFQKLVRDYPNSDYVQKATEQLKLMGAVVPEPNPARLQLLPPEKKSFISNFKNQLFGLYPLTINKDGVLMTNNFDKTKFELIDQIIENQGDVSASQIPKALTTVISNRP